MKVSVQVIIESESGQAPVVEHIACLERASLDPGRLGLTLAEAKGLLARAQAVIVIQQVAEYVEQQRVCPDCGKKRSSKGEHELVYRTLFGQLSLPSPRLTTCACQPLQQRSVSPLAELLPERTAPELLYLQTKWAARMSYGLTVDLLEEVLPLQTNAMAVHRHVEQVAERSEQELGEEQFSFVDGCPRD
jgi:hypothetical protein